MLYTIAIVLAGIVMIEFAVLTRGFLVGYRRGLADAKVFDFSAWKDAALEDEREACQYWIAEGSPRVIARLNAIEVEQSARRATCVICEIDENKNEVNYAD